MIFDSKALALKERKDLDKLSMDELHAILTAYEMRIKQEKPSRNEVAFKAFNKIKKKYQESKYFP